MTWETKIKVCLAAIFVAAMTLAVYIGYHMVNITWALGLE